MSKILCQKEVFLNGEGDAWCLRNAETVARINYANDPVVRAFKHIVSSPLCVPDRSGVSTLEIGCGEGVKAFQGTADSLQFPDNSFDIVIFGFCLYLCDRNDLFEIAREADRVLKPQGWLVINDFFSEVPIKRDYHHKPGMYSYKMDYRQLFTWHPYYTCFSHLVTSHGSWATTDEKQEWVSTSIIRKNFQ